MKNSSYCRTAVHGGGALQGPLDSPCALLLELQRNKDNVCLAVRGGPRTPSTTTDANLDRAFVENALFYTDP